MNYEEGENIICTVTNIVRTTVFVETLDGIKGSIVISEIAPGRIRNLRAYVVPKKIIVCKILHIRGDHLFLSLRRVKPKETKELMAAYKKGKTYESVIKKLVGKEAESILKKIKTTQSLNDFIEAAREDSKILGKYFNKEQTATLEKVIKEKENKEKEIKKEFRLFCKAPNGILVIKKLLTGIEGITYLGNSKFTIKRQAIDLKKLDSELNLILETIEKASRKDKCEFSIVKN